MTKKRSILQKSTPLLPVGFYDLLFDEAEAGYKRVNIAIDSFLESDYRLIKTPLVEFGDNFSHQNLENSFRTTDVISGKSLVFRNDITLQISRLLNSRLKGCELPLRVCYVGDVLCARSDNLYVDRQQTQVGLEIIGCDLEDSNFEIIQNTLDALEKMDAKSSTIEFCLNDLLEILLSEIGIADIVGLSEAIASKNISKIRELAGEFADMISKIVLVNDDVNTLCDEILGRINSDKIAHQLASIQKISKLLESRNIKVRFDLFGDQNSSYHNQISFDIFADDFSYPIARGGRYKIECEDKKVGAVGATIYMNRLKRL